MTTFLLKLVNADDLPNLSLHLPQPSAAEHVRQQVSAAYSPPSPRPNRHSQCMPQREQFHFLLAPVHPCPHRCDGVPGAYCAGAVLVAAGNGTIQRANTRQPRSAPSGQPPRCVDDLWLYQKYRYDVHYHYQHTTPPTHAMWQEGILSMDCPEAIAWLNLQAMTTPDSDSSDG